MELELVLLVVVFPFVAKSKFRLIRGVRNWRDGRKRILESGVIRRKRAMARRVIAVVEEVLDRFARRVFRWPVADCRCRGFEWLLVSVMRRFFVGVCEFLRSRMRRLQRLV